MLSLIATQFKVQKELSIIYYFWYIHYLFKVVFVLSITDTIKSSRYSVSLRFKETNDEVKLTYWKGKSTYVDQKLDCLLCWYIYWYSDEDIPPSVIDTPSSKGSLLHRRRLPRLPGGEGPHRGLSQVNTTATCQSHSSISSFHVDVHQFYTFFWFNFYYQKYFISHHDISHIFSHIFSA